MQPIVPPISNIVMRASYLVMADSKDRQIWYIYLPGMVLCCSWSSWLLINVKAIVPSSSQLKEANMLRLK